MKSIKIIFALVAILTTSFSVKADHDQNITFNQLPQAAQTLLKQHFVGKVPLVVTMDWNDYKIVYETGEEIEFDKQGNWKQLDCRTSQVPAALIPEKIKAHINATFPGAAIIDLDRDRRGYEVRLSNGMEVEYNRNFQAIEIGD